MELWIPITLAAAFLQNVRSGLQKHLKGAMGTTGATFVRFGFGMPFVLVLLAGLHWGMGYAFPPLSPRFLWWAVVGGVAQIGGTFLLVHLFSHRNFAAGSAYSRTEPVLAALLGWLVLGDPVGLGMALAIAICVAGVMLLSLARTSLEPGIGPVGALLAALTQRSALIGLTSGACFGLAAMAYRAASLALGGPNALMQATVTLAFVITLQCLSMLVWMALREPGEFARIGRAWVPSLIVGLVGASASLGWFAAMTLQNAGVVKALAQVEMLFTVATSVLIFRERINRWELAGCGLIVIGIVVLMVLR